MRFRPCCAAAGNVRPVRPRHPGSGLGEWVPGSSESAKLLRLGIEAARVLGWDRDREGWPC
ncbi:hypothetical protein HMPREF0724_11405 [Prescottella equi ATCC 33707]|uniref:Uncharacterized protein n=1 Tax=Prescottella equi ATCC 33707 TaxID=525370 RepID=E9SZB3_RHOHA|nr:hypothetical protein HMPREF0724_11405 [Prescottella equi ATCC 33707]